MNISSYLNPPTLLLSHLFCQCKTYLQNELFLRTTPKVGWRVHSLWVVKGLRLKAFGSSTCVFLKVIHSCTRIETNRFPSGRSSRCRTFVAHQTCDSHPRCIVRKNSHTWGMVKVTTAIDEIHMGKKWNKIKHALYGGHCCVTYFNYITALKVLSFH